MLSSREQVKQYKNHNNLLQKPLFFSHLGNRRIHRKSQRTKLQTSPRFGLKRNECSNANCTKGKSNLTIFLFLFLLLTTLLFFFINFCTLTQHVILPASIIPSQPQTETSLLSANREQIDGVQGTTSGNEESDIEIRPVETKPVKKTKSKTKIAARKTTRKTVKTDYNEFSD